jgi:hypothetical protein
LELFNRTCDEEQDRILEKGIELDTTETGPDLKEVLSLQGRHQHPELELASVEERVQREDNRTECVNMSHTSERKKV